MIPSPCSVTTTASDDEFSMPTNNPGWSCGSHFPPLAGLAGKCKIFSPNSRIVVLSFRPCSLCSGVFPSLPMSHLFTRYAAKSTSQHSILESGGTLAPMRCSSAVFSVLPCPTARSMIQLDWLSPSWLSLQNLASLLATLCEFPRQCLNRRFIVASERDSVVPKLVDELRYSLRNPVKFNSISRNQHRPRNFVSFHG